MTDIKNKKGIGLRFAFKGWISFFSERNAFIHLCAAVLAIAAGLYLGLAPAEWLWIGLAIALVWITEMLNSALELLADLVKPEHDPTIGRLKDISAGAVLVAVCFALVVAGIIFVPHVADLLHR